jgi:hypothetical protein
MINAYTRVVTLKTGILYLLLAHVLHAALRKDNHYLLPASRLKF